MLLIVDGYTATSPGWTALDDEISVTAVPRPDTDVARGGALLPIIVQRANGTLLSLMCYGWSHTLGILYVSPMADTETEECQVRCAPTAATQACTQSAMLRTKVVVDDSNNPYPVEFGGVHNLWIAEDVNLVLQKFSESDVTDVFGVDEQAPSAAGQVTRLILYDSNSVQPAFAIQILESSVQWEIGPPAFSLTVRTIIVELVTNGEEVFGWYHEIPNP